MVSMRLAMSLLTVLVASVPAYAQPCGQGAAGSPISTDRPQVTNSSVVVPCGSLQIENGFEEAAAGGRQGFDLPETLVRLGVLSRTEVRLGIPGYFYKADTGTGFANGFSDLALGLKQQLGPVHGFDVSVIPSVSLPSGATRISSHGYDPAVQLPWSRALSKNWTADGMLSVSWPTQSSGRNVTGQSSLYFDRQLTQPWDAYVEYSGAFASRGGPQHTIDAGTAYKLTPHQQIDVHVNFGLAAAAPDHAIGFGYSVRFQAFGAR